MKLLYGQSLGGLILDAASILSLLVIWLLFVVFPVALVWFIFTSDWGI